MGKAVVTPHSVYEAIAALRQALGDTSDRPIYVATLPRRGYRLIAAVERGALGEQTETRATAGLMGQPGRSAPDKADAAEESILADTPIPLVSPNTDRAPAVSGRLRRHAPALALLGVALIATLAIVWLLHRSPAPVVAVSADKSIAVLPFIDLSETKNQEYLADGLAEELLEVLVSVPGLRVIGRTSSFQFRNKNEDVRSIGRQLGAAYVVEGSVRRDGDQIRVAAQLIRSTDGIHQWSGTYDRHVKDTLLLESELAMALGRALQLSVNSSLDSSRRGTSSAEANDHYLRGLHALDEHSRSGTEEAIDQFQAALALDSRFESAVVALGMAHYVQAAFNFVPPPTGFPRVREDAQAVLELNPRSAIAHALLARVATLYAWDWYEAGLQAKRALALEPQNSFALFAAGDLAAVLGDLERAERLFRAALVSDPLNPEVHYMLALVLPGRGQIEEAELEARRCLSISPSYVGAHYLLASFLMDKNGEQAVAECRRETSDGGQLPCLAQAYHAQGLSKEAEASLKEAIETRGADQAYLIASAFASFGQSDLAFEWLNRAYDQRDPVLQYMKTSPEFDHMKADPRYAQLLRRMNYPTQ